jgi:competence protein ComEC
MLARIPSLKLFIPFVLGIGIWQLLGQCLSWHFVIGCSVFFTVLLVIFQYTKNYYQYTYAWVNGISIFTIALLSGYTVCSLQQAQHHATHYSHAMHNSSIVTATVQEPLVAKPNSFKTVLRIKTIANGDTTKQVSGDAYGYFTKTKEAPTLQPGDVIMIQANAAPLKANGNPGEFDYAAYSARRGITHSIYITPLHYVKLARKNASLFTFFALQKIKCLRILDTYITNPKAQGIAQALLIGDRTNIDEQIWEAYKNTGIVHIIAISGMHLGLIYFQLVRLLLLIPIFKKNKKTTTMFAILLMWAFSCLIGMPPSVARAGVIFSIIGVGQLINRKNYTYNSLVFSAFVLLVIEPNWILDVGFLLSYAAIFGILLFAQKIDNRLYHPNKIWQKFTTDISTTIAAQIFTLPICLYYFHQFPVLLLASNLIAIVATTYILYAEILLLLMHFLGLTIVCHWLGKIIGVAIVWLNNCVLYLSKIPFFNIQHIQISMSQYVILFVMMSCIAYGLMHRHTKALIAASICLIGFWAMSIVYQKNAARQQLLIVHHAAKKSIVQVINGHNYKLISADSINHSDEKNILQPAQLVYYTQPKPNAIVVRNDAFILQTVSGKTILQLQKSINIDAAIPPIDYLILQHNAPINILQTVQQLQPKRIIIDGSNSLWKIEQWKTALATVSLQPHITNTQGAFVAHL